jgi:lysozyme family protein
VFEEIFKHLILAEGGYVDHPMDSGGPTKYGITQKSWSFFKNKHASRADMQALTEEDAMEFYYQNYWKPLWLNDFKSKMFCHVLFDQAVNRGLVSVVKQMQSMINAKYLNVINGYLLVVDGIFGPATKKALSSIDLDEFAFEFLLESQISYCRIVQNNPTQSVFITGWIARTQSILKELWKTKKEG